MAGSSLPGEQTAGAIFQKGIVEVKIPAALAAAAYEHSQVETAPVLRR